MKIRHVSVRISDLEIAMCIVPFTEMLKVKGINPNRYYKRIDIPKDGCALFIQQTWCSDIGAK